MSPTSTYELTSDGRERSLLVGLVVPGLPRSVVEEHLDELERLVDTNRRPPLWLAGASCSVLPNDVPMKPLCR